MIKQWVFESGIDSFIEAAYLGVPVTTRGLEGFVNVNPSSFRYLMGKVAVINNPDYPIENIRWMLENDIKVISRISNPLVECDPYILRIEFKVMWNGDVIHYVPGSTYSDILNVLKINSEVEPVNTDQPMRVFLPKIEGIPENILLDTLGNLTGLGWAMHQVGINVRRDLPYQDLDLYKTKKILL